MNNKKNKIMIIGAYPHSIISFRGHLIKSLVDKGHQVTVLTAQAPEEIVQQIEVLGAQFKSFSVQRNGLNPWQDLKTFLALRRHIKQIQPDKILAYTIKPIIWGGLAARSLKQKGFFAMVTGLGYAFEKGGLLRNTVSSLVKGLYRLALKKSQAVIFQNDDNLNCFVELGLAEKAKCFRVFGSGVDTTFYKQTPLPQGNTRFLLIARLLGDKGIREYVEAAREIKTEYPDVSFELLGPYDSSPDRISEQEITRWQKEGIIDYLGETTNVLPYIEACHIYVLPSYHEGLPRTVLEAMAVGRPIITTNAVGCKDTVIEGRNGYKVPVKDAHALAQSIRQMLSKQNSWQKMAQACRQMACSKFDVHKVNQHIYQILFQDEFAYFAPSCERNKHVILENAYKYFEKSVNVLEVGSYSGQHAIYISSELEHIQWQPSDLKALVPRLNNNLVKFASANVKQAIEIDLLNEGQWPTSQFDTVYTANTLHIMSWQHVQKLFERLDSTIKPSGYFITYGPFKYGDEYTSSSNAEFELWLKDRDIQSGIRDFEAVNELAISVGLTLVEDIAMPANNQLLIWQKKTN